MTYMLAAVAAVASRLGLRLVAGRVLQKTALDAARKAQHSALFLRRVRER